MSLTKVTDDLVMQSNGETARSNSPIYIWQQRPSLWGGDVAGTPTENAARLQAQVDALAADGGGTLRLVEDVIQIDRPLVLPNKVSVIGPGSGRCLLQNTFSDTSLAYLQAPVFSLGNWSTATIGTGSGSTGGFYGNSNSKAVNAVGKGDLAATLTTAGDAAGYAVDDLAVFFSSNYYVDGSANKVPYYMAIRRITRISGAVLYVDEPFMDGFSGSAYNLRTGSLLGEPTVVGATGARLSVWGDAELAGFSVDTVGSWSGGSSALYKGQMSDIEVLRSRRVGYGNTYQYCVLDGVSGRFMDKAFELSLNSENTVVKNFNVSYDAANRALYWPANNPTGAISMQENDLYMTYRDGRIDMTGFAIGNPVLNINNAEYGAYDNLTIINGGAGTVGNVIDIGVTSSDAGNKREATNGYVNIQWSGVCQRYVQIRATVANPTGTTGNIIDGVYRGLPSANAVAISGATALNTIAPTAYFEQGTLNISSGVVNQELIGPYIGGGVSTGADYTTFLTNNVRAIRTTASTPRRGGTNTLSAQTTHTGTTTKTNILTGAIGTSTLRRQDVVDFNIRVNVTGTAGIKTITVDLVDSTTPTTYTPVSFSVPALTTGIITLSGRIMVTTPALIFTEAQTNVSAVTVTTSSIATDLSAKNLTFGVTATLANAADSVVFGAAILQLTNPVQI